MKETLLTVLDIVLSWIGLTRTKHVEYICEYAQCTEIVWYQYRSYLQELRDATPHSNIKEEINELLISTPESIRADLFD